MTVDEFMAGLDTELPRGVKDKLAKAINAEPKLRRAFDEFKKARGTGRPAAQLMRVVRAIPEFRQLLARFRSDGGFQAAFLKLQQNPRMAKALMGQMPAPEQAVAAGGRGGSQGAMASAGLRGPGSAISGGLGRGTTRLPDSRVEAPSYQAAGPVLAAAGPGAGAAGAGGRGEGEGGPSMGGSVNDPRGPVRDDDNKVTPLQGPAGTCSQQMDHVLRDWLASYHLNPDVFLNNRNSGIWDQCFQEHRLKACDDACKNQPTTQESQVDASCRAEGHTRIASVCALPSDPTYWGTCMIVYGNELECVQACREQRPPCQIPAPIWDKYCVPKYDSHGKQTNPPVPYPQCGADASAPAKPSAPDSYTGVDMWQCVQGKNQYYSDGRCWVQGHGVCCVHKGTFKTDVTCVPVVAGKENWISETCTCASDNMTAPTGYVPNACD